MSHRKDTDYLSISTRIRAMENRMLTRERADRLIDAKDDEEASKVLSECGYGDASGDLETMLSKSRALTMADMASAVPEGALVAVFALKYDYHNIKVALKALAQGLDPVPLLLEGGRYSKEHMANCARTEDYRDFTPVLSKAAMEAKTLLSETGDPQQADFLLDRAYFSEMSELAKGTGSSYFMGYIALQIDVSNLRAVVRGLRLQKESDFLRGALVDGGTVSAHRLATVRAEDIASLFQVGGLSEAATAGVAAASDSSVAMTTFERLCDNALVAYLSNATRIPFGEEPVIAYLAAKENEITAIRTIMSGRSAGLDAEIIRTRLRDFGG
ncbi:MAG: V-type ATPase subunit [Eubacteriales bacterium]